MEIGMRLLLVALAGAATVDAADTAGALVRPSMLTSTLLRGDVNQVNPTLDCCETVVITITLPGCLCAVGEDANVKESTMDAASIYDVYLICGGTTPMTECGDRSTRGTIRDAAVDTPSSWPESTIRRCTESSTHEFFAGTA